MSIMKNVHPFEPGWWSGSQGIKMTTNEWGPGLVQALPGQELLLPNAHGAGNASKLTFIAISLFEAYPPPKIGPSGL